MAGLSIESSSPLYRQLIESLRSDIAGGIYPPHSRIPSEAELCEQYGVSRVTVRKALAEMTRDGLLERYQGKGTFVAMPKIRRDLKEVTSFHNCCRMMKCEPGTRVVKVETVTATEDDRECLLLEPAEHQVLSISRLRMADGVPVMLEENRFPMAYLYLKDCALDGSLYAILREHQVEPGQATHDIALSYASAAQAELLEVPVGSALLSLHEVIYDRSGHALHISRQLIRGDRFTFRI